MTKYATEWVHSIELFKDGVRLDSPTIDAGDFLISSDFGTFDPIDTLPTVEPAGSGQVKLTVSVLENTAAHVHIQWHRADGGWDDGGISYNPTVNDLDDLATAASLAALNNLSAAQVNSEVDTALADYDGPTNAELAAALAALNDLDAAAVWSNPVRTLTTPGSSTTTPAEGDPLSVVRGTSWSISLTGLGDLTGRTRLYFAIKRKLSSPDAHAILLVQDDAEGLLVFAGSVPIDAANGTITIDDEELGNITVTVKAAETIAAPVEDGLLYGTKISFGGDPVNLPKGNGLINIGGDVPRAIE